MNVFLKLCVLSVNLLIVTSANALSLVTGATCNEQASLTVSELSFQFPKDKVKHINILNAGSASAVLTFDNDWMPLLHIITTDETKVSGGINERGGFEKLGVTNITDLYKKAKTEESSTEYFSKVKKALALTNPNDIHISPFDNGNTIVHENAYENGADAVYIIRDNDHRILMLVADMDEQQLKKILGHVCL
ncbi:hypothetical protein [Bermanella sp. R86510]|uniref:hypothetical protein n=1 Tax=unclassified Bermanella TaxID=2627862 RepID=UPI0037C998EC